ncbi:hypothetical protein ACLOJK_030071 [Asimina triloba]
MRCVLLLDVGFRSSDFRFAYHQFLLSGLPLLIGDEDMLDLREERLLPVGSAEENAMAVGFIKEEHSRAGFNGVIAARIRCAGDGFRLLLRLALMEMTDADG